MTGLVDDWDRYQRANPDKSSVVLARTRAEVRALSHLMRERRFAPLPDAERADADRVTVTVSRGTEDDRTASPLEIARGDRLRIGATHWEKQLFNGTVVTVDDFKVERAEAGTEPSVLISAHTEDGRAVSFRHDEIRDWYGNIRLDHGYALTISSAQGLTVDRTFLLADARPARETIYPAATRHREGLDIYVNRAPLALDIADRRADNDREVAVTDTEIRTWLAERWSRSQPKEAALDYMAGDIWEERRENVRENRSRSPGEGQGEVGDIRAAANDNALARIARDVRRTAFGWRHAQAVGSFVDGRRQVLAAYDDLRERTRIEGDAVALSGAYRETLTRHAVLLKQAETFRARPDDFASLLAQRGGIGRKDLDAFEDLHTRARCHRRAATMRYVHRIKREAEQQGIEPEKRQGGLPLEGGAIEAAERAETEEWNTIAAPTEVHADVAVPVGNVEPVKPDWYAPYMALRQDWNAFIEGARQAGILSFYASGYADMIPRIQALAENPDVPAVTRQPMMQVLANHQRHLSTRKHIGDYLDQVDQHIEEHDSMESLAEELGMKVAEISDYPDWPPGERPPDDGGRGHPLGHEDPRFPSRSHPDRRDTHEMGALEHEPRHPPRRRGHQRGSHRGRKAACPAGNARGAGAAGRTGGSQIPPASVGCRRCSHSGGTRRGAKGIRRLCGAPLRFARRRGARGPLNIQELEHPPLTATRLATSAPFPVTSWHGCRQSPNR